MSKNYFKTIRKSYITGTLLTTLLSNIMVFGQPIQQMTQLSIQLEETKPNRIYHMNAVLLPTEEIKTSVVGANHTNKNANSNIIDESSLSAKKISTTEGRPEKNNSSKIRIAKSVEKKNVSEVKYEPTPINKTVKKNTATVFYALETQGLVGTTTAAEKENPRDNFFTIILPEAINYETHDVVLKYNLYGLDASSFTTKSINNNPVYGGQAVKVNEHWNLVEEYIPAQYMKEGRNEIFFNRRADQTYAYTIKDLSIELVNKREGALFINQEKLFNFDGNIHVMGYVTDNTNEVAVLGQTIPVTNGVFEAVLKDVSNDFKTLKINYGDNGSLSKKYEIKHKGEGLNFVFNNEKTTGDKTIVKNNTQGILSNEALEVKNVLSINGFTISELKLEGIDFEELRPLNTDVENVTFGKYLGYRLKTLVKRDSSSFKLHLKYDAAIIPDGYSDKDVRTFSFDKTKREWIALPVDSLDYQNKVIITNFNGDTDYINGVIKVPEIAETSSFTPTTISDMKYADPSAGVVSIAPPSPNSNGIASTSFPIKLPAGRNGMAPSVSINYNSEGGNGWMGVGWNTQLPAITLDTRWGTPRFELTKESEIYQLNGEQLVLKVGETYTNPHRYTLPINRVNHREYYLRKEGSYLKIKRWGGSTKNYVWEVTDKFGNRSFYGGDPNINSDDNTIIRDNVTPTGNITHWALYKTIDPNGNYVEYTYDKGTPDAAEVNNIPAQYFYPKTIKYTLKGNSNPNYYQVDFLRKNYTLGSIDPAIKSDVNLSARTGTMMAEHELLTEIKIKYVDGQDNPIRGYTFEYEEAPFSKKQLSKISEYDTAGNLFYSNTMEYYDEVGNGQVIDDDHIDYLGDDEGISGPADIVSNGSALGTGTTSGFSFGLRGGGGIGFNTSSVTSTIGGSFNYSESKEKTKISFLDINGDGLADKVYQKGNNLEYLPNLGSQIGFGAARSVSNLNKLNNSRSRTTTGGADANIGITSDFSVGAAKGWSTTRTTTADYFTDFNGDGLADVLDGNIVKFNKTNPWIGDQYPTVGFDDNSATTANTIHSGQINPAIIPNLQLETLEELRENHAQFDHVKAWQAPYSGQISIQSVAALLQFNTCDDEGYQNTFRLTIEIAGANQSTGTTQRINIGGASQWILSASSLNKTLNKPNLNIDKGDKLFFRIHNSEFGCGGEVEWNPVITYSNTDGSVFNSQNEHNKEALVFDAEDDYIINNGSTWKPSQEDVTLNFNTNFGVNVVAQNVPNLTDEVRFVIKKTTYTHNVFVPVEHPEYGQILDQNSQDDNELGIIDTRVVRLGIDGSVSNLGPASLNVMKNVGFQFVYGETNPAYNKSYTYQFYVESDSNVEWDDINWKPTITSTASSPSITHFPSISYRTYDNNINETNNRFTSNLITSPAYDSDPSVPNDTEILTISHNMFTPNLYNQIIPSFNDAEFPIKINWVVKENNNLAAKLLHKKTFFLYKGNCVTPPGQPEQCLAVFKTNTGQVINPNSTTHKPYFEYYLTKQELIDITNNGGSLFSKFYVDNEVFGDDNPADITLRIKDEQQGNFTFTPNVLDKPFITEENTLTGIAYRGWGQFLYNGGTKDVYNDQGVFIETLDFESNINMEVFDYFNNPGANQAEPNQNQVIRSLFYTQQNENDSYSSQTIISRVESSNDLRIPVSYAFDNGKLISKLGRFAEPNLHELHVSDSELGLTNGGGSTSNFIGLKQYGISKGTSTNGDVNVAGVGGSGTFSDAWSKTLSQYVDLNGDRYPDIVTDGNIQFTSMRGGLSVNNLTNNFTSGSSSVDNTIGVSIAGVIPHSTTSDNVNNTRTNVNSGLNTSQGTTFNSKQWVDINGDGLTDQVTITTTGVVVKLNTGYDFMPTDVLWSAGIDLSLLVTSTRGNTGVGFGASDIGTSSFGAGFGVATSTARLNAGLIDVNGDGLPDLVKRNTSDEYTFYLNTGSKFELAPTQMFYNGDIDKDRSITGNAYGSYTSGPLFTIPSPLPPFIIPIKVTGTVTASLNGGVNDKMITVQDINGDGLPDVLEKGGDNGDVKATLNKIGKTHLLKTVNTPLGGSWTVDYNREGNTYDMPQNKWALHEIITRDGFAADANFGPDETLTAISYSSPKHDRREREFLGFGEVKTEQKDPSTGSTFRYSVATYHNDNVYLKGSMKNTSVFDNGDTILSESSTLYNIMKPTTPVVDLNISEAQHYLQNGINLSLLDHSRLFVAPVKTISTTFEDGNSLSVEQHFLKYSSTGNLEEYKNLGDTYASTNDAYRTEMEYYPSIASLNNSTGYVKSIQVKQDNDGTLLRQREAAYNDTGKLIQVKTKLNDTETNQVTLAYNDFGNVTSSTLQNGFETQLTYETVLNTYPIQVSNTFGETSTTNYDYLFGIPVVSTDVNGQEMRTRFDNRGRVVEVTAPNELLENSTADQWTIRMEYEGETAIPDFNSTDYMVQANGVFEAIAPGTTPLTAAKHHAVTRHNVANAQGGQLLTVSLVDGVGKAIQLKKTLFANNQVKWLISGKEKKDAFGRVLEARLPTVQGGYPMTNNLTTSDFNYQAGQNAIPPTIMTYDNRDRVISVKQPGENQTATTDYSIAEGMFMTTATNELSQTFENYTDVRGRQRKSIQNGDLTTELFYNTVGEKIKVKNQQGYESLYEYDLAGRRLEEKHPDRGLSTYKYDELSNLTERSTSNLMANGTQDVIKYAYDQGNRLIETVYPQNPENNVKYTYGLIGNTDAEDRNAIGRMYLQEDASGVQGFGYDRLGNLDRHLRGIAVAGRHTFWFDTQWVYDSHSRVEQIVYPDGERVRYNYNAGGTLRSLMRTIDNVVTNAPIVSNIKYNDLGERTEITYGNGTSASYTYDNRRRLAQLGHQFTGFNITNRYKYDALSNIEQVATINPETSVPSVNQLGGPAIHNYKYDDYNRLVQADGRYTGPNDLGASLLAQEYKLDMTYDLAHNITSKTQTHVQGAVDSYNGAIMSPETMVKTNYHLDYGGYATGVNVTPGPTGDYGYVQPHAPREIIETPEDNGIVNTDPNYKKKLIAYDANGNQTTITQVVTEAPSSSAYEGTVSQEETVLRKNLWDEENRLRAVDLNPEDTSNHPLAVYTYDAGRARAVRYIPGRLDVRSNANNASKNERDEVMLYPSPLITAKAMTTPGIAPQMGDLTTKYTKHYYIGTQRINSTLGTARDIGLYPQISLGNIFPTIRPLANARVDSATTGLTNTYVDLQQTIALNAPVIEGNSRPNHDAKKYDAYWYHSDHIGSSSYVTNLAGLVTQHMEYLPYGETLVDEHQNSYNTPYKFNGKELDEETGNYYYGARYYDPKFSMWLSVDPLAEQMPEWSSYNYVFSNPVKFTDPTGLAPESAQWPPKGNIKTSSKIYYSFEGKGKHKFTRTDTWSRTEYSENNDGTYAEKTSHMVTTTISNLELERGNDGAISSDTKSSQVSKLYTTTSTVEEDKSMSAVTRSNMKTTSKVVAQNSNMNIHDLYHFDDDKQLIGRIGGIIKLNANAGSVNATFFNQPSTVGDNVVGGLGVFTFLMEAAGKSLGIYSLPTAAATTGWSIGSFIKRYNLITEGTRYRKSTFENLD